MSRFEWGPSVAIPAREPAAPPRRDDLAVTAWYDPAADSVMVAVPPHDPSAVNVPTQLHVAWIPAGRAVPEAAADWMADPEAARTGQVPAAPGGPETIAFPVPEALHEISGGGRVILEFAE